MRESTKDLSRLAKISLDLANIVDRQGDKGLNNYWDGLGKELGLGHLALSHYLRSGVKAIADAEMEISNLRASNKLMKVSEKEMGDFLEDIFGIEEPESLCDELKDKLRAFVQDLLDNEGEGEEE